MESLRSMFFGTKPRAVKWLGMGRSTAHDDDDDTDTSGRLVDRMFVHPEAATEVLQPLGDEPINLISIFGAARQGKSFLMNLLADQQDLFKISNLREPCTQGVDLSGHFIPLPKFSGLNGCPAVTNNPVQVGFVDAEGQGDRDITYDSRLVSPVLLASKAVLFNWKDSLQADRILNLLAVLARAAQGIEVADGDKSKVFGHLHIVFRDWSFVDSSPDDVYRDLFAKEKGRSDEVNVRNLARANLVDAFESITVWLFPPPVANTANLKDKIRFEQLHQGFQEKLRDLRKCLSMQLQEPMQFGGKPLTARLLSQMVPLLVDTLNSDEVIMPESIYSSMVRAEAKAVKDDCERRIASYCEAAGVEEVVSADEFEKLLRHDIEFLITEAMDGMKDYPATVRKEMQEALGAFASKEMKIALHANNSKITELLSREVDNVMKNLQSECKVIEEEGIPMRTDLLKRHCNDFLDLELSRLEVLPKGASGRRDIDAEISRLKQHARVLFDKLEVANEKAIQLANAEINDHVRKGKKAMTDKIHERLDKVFSVRTPVTVATLQAELDEHYRTLIRELREHIDANPFMSYDAEDLDHHKSHLAEELNRRYYLEIRQILSEVGFTAKEDLGKEIALRLDGKLPLPDDEIKASIDESVLQIKSVVAKQLQGWTVLKSDVGAKSMEIEKLGDVYAYEYLRRNQDLMKDVSLRQEQEQYEDLKAEVVEEFQRGLKTVDFPTADTHIDAVFANTLKEMISEFMTVETTSPNFSATILYDRLSADCKPEVETQKALNRLASEKEHALRVAQKERMLREQENLVAQKKEEQISADRAKKRKTPTSGRTSTDKGPRMSLDEARRAAQAEVERRIQERASSLKASAKKKK
ncbi:hypothetical protein ATCC90586_008924 [Pythium insidiosum]|nr:hypothetical protein ATCC90586_008924 [Pythium insidiosum]